MLRNKIKEEWGKLKYRCEGIVLRVDCLIRDRDSYKTDFDKVRHELDQGWDGFVNAPNNLVRCNSCKSISVEIYDPQTNSWVWGNQELPNCYVMFKSRIRRIYQYYQRK